MLPIGSGQVFHRASANYQPAALLPKWFGSRQQLHFTATEINKPGLIADQHGGFEQQSPDNDRNASLFTAELARAFAQPLLAGGRFKTKCRQIVVHALLQHRQIAMRLPGRGEQDIVDRAEIADQRAMHMQHGIALLLCLKLLTELIKQLLTLRVICAVQHLALACGQHEVGQFHDQVHSRSSKPHSTSSSRILTTLYNTARDASLAISVLAVPADKPSWQAMALTAMPNNAHLLMP